jgi:dynein heavy chain 2
MKGVSDLSERAGFFRPIAEGAAAAATRVYEGVELLFAKLAAQLTIHQVRAC